MISLQEKYIIGLDLGINNVGYSIINVNDEIIEEKGVRLYTEASKSEDRRISRNARRRKKRKNNRISESLKLFEKINFPNHITIETNLIAIRVKSLKEKITQQEMVNIICYLMSHRGYIPFGDEGRNLIDLNGKLPCEYYLEKWNQQGKYRASEEVVNHSDLKKELEEILHVQMKYYPELKNIQENLITIFDRKRKFWEGPGSETSFTPYGRFKNQEDVIQIQELKKAGKEKYLFEDLIGKCKIYPHEQCAVNANIFAEKFNLLNDFINIKINNIENIKNQEYVYLSQTKELSFYKLTTQGLEEIWKYCMNNISVSYTKVLKDVLGLTKKDISGYRIDRDGKPEFSLLNIYHMVKKVYQDNKLDMSWLIDNDFQNYNELMKTMAVAPGIVEIDNMLSQIHVCTLEEKKAIQEIQNKLKKSNTKALQYHALSEKALKRAIHDMLSTCLNFMQVSHKFDYDKEAREERIRKYGNGEGLLLMNSVLVDDIVASPQVKKTLRQSIRIINAIIKEKGTYPEIIAVESTTEMNGQEKRKEIEKEQKENEKNRKQAISFLETYARDEQITENMIERIMLFEEINGMCPYCGKPIDKNLVLNNTVEVEHILPISQSADDSFDNKTISCRDCNSKKKNKIPYNFLSDTEFEEFSKRICNLKISEKKKKNFLLQEDINKYSTRFFNRNLRDTAYATKEMINQIHYFNEYLESYGTKINIKTLSIPGQLTHKIRKQWDLDKDRDDGKYHHAVDASIVAGIATTPIGKLVIESQNNPQFWIMNQNIGTKIEQLLLNFNMYQYKDAISQIKSDDDIKISMQVNKDINRSLSNANICSFIKKENQYYKISQIDNIYAPDLIRKKEDKEKLEVLLDDQNEKFTLLCQTQNPKLFHFLQEIYQKYQNNNENPFLNYCLEKMDLDTKFDYLKNGIVTPSKNGNGVLIKKLRYMEKVNSPFLLEKKNMNKKENTLIGLDSVSIYCTRLYWDKENKKIIFVPVYSPVVNQKTKTINESHPLYIQYYNEYVKGKNVEFIEDLYNGNYIEITKSNGEILKEYVKGFSKSNKSIQCKSGKYLSPKDKFTLYDVDVLGNKKKRLTWPKE